MLFNYVHDMYMYHNKENIQLGICEIKSLLFMLIVIVTHHVAGDMKVIIIYVHLIRVSYYLCYLTLCMYMYHNKENIQLGICDIMNKICKLKLHVH